MIVSAYIVTHFHVAKVQDLNIEIIEKGKELNIMKNKANARKEHGIKQFHSITLEAKKPEKIDSQNPLTVQLLKDMQSPQNGVFAINRFSTSLYPI